MSMVSSMSLKPGRDPEYLINDAINQVDRDEFPTNSTESSPYGRTSPQTSPQAYPPCVYNQSPTIDNTTKSSTGERKRVCVPVCGKEQ